MHGVYCLFGMELTSELLKKWNNSAFAEYIYLNLNFFIIFLIKK